MITRERQYMYVLDMSYLDLYLCGCKDWNASWAPICMHAIKLVALLFAYTPHNGALHDLTLLEAVRINDTVDA